MENVERLSLSTAYIDDHLTEEITVDMLAKLSGYSYGHFQRVFASYYGISAASYIRRMRLRSAAGAILCGTSISEAASKYVFSSLAVFSRAFHREFGISPKEYQIHNSSLNETGNSPYLGLRPRFKTCAAIKVACYPLKKKNLFSKNFSEESAYWYKVDFSRYDMAGYARAAKGSRGEAGVWYRKDPSVKSLTYMYGLVVDDFINVPKDMCCIEIPTATYAVFTTRPVPLTGSPSLFHDSICQLWSEIFFVWLPENLRYRFDTDKLGFEFYAPANGCLASITAVMDIYVPIIIEPEHLI